MNNTVNNILKKTSEKLSDNYNKQNMVNTSLKDKLPDTQTVYSIIKDLLKITFPGYFGTENFEYLLKETFIDSVIASIYEKLNSQIKISLMYRDGKEKIKSKAEVYTTKFIEQIPQVQELLMKDVEAQLAGDPAADSKEEVILSYPGLYAIFVYRYAHLLYQMNIPFLPRIMSEYAHGKTGIDINPGAVIGEYFFIDHGTGIVIGETAVIGNGVKIYQGVTLGALSTRKGQLLSGIKRHPTIEDNVVIYANTTILGGDTVVGKNSIVAGNTFVTKSIPADTKVTTLLPELEIRKR